MKNSRKSTRKGKTTYIKETIAKADFSGMEKSSHAGCRWVNCRLHCCMRQIGDLGGQLVIIREQGRPRDAVLQCYGLL